MGRKIAMARKILGGRLAVLVLVLLMENGRENGRRERVSSNIFRANFV